MKHPEIGDRDQIYKFASGFDGYTFCGGFDEAADVFRSQPRDSLDNLRVELFFAYRCANHQGDDSILLDRYSELKPFFDKFVGD